MELEYSELPPYALLRQIYEVFGLAHTSRERFEGESQSPGSRSNPPSLVEDAELRAAPGLITLIDLSRCSPVMVTALGVSVGLAAAAILAKGDAKVLQIYGGTDEIQVTHAWPAASWSDKSHSWLCVRLR
jgi:hypothetical protein